MPTRSGGRACVNCGDPFRGPGDLCGDCRPAPLAAKPARPGRAACCPWCKAPADWPDLGRLERRVGGVLEVIYYCGACRAFLESASWMELRSSGPTRS